MAERLEYIPLNRIAIADNYRKTMSEKSLKELAASIEQYGVQEPILVRELVDGSFELIAGQRRFRASESIGAVTIPAIVKDIAPDRILALQIIENVQRENVPFMEEADALRQLRDEQALDGAEIAKLIGKSEWYVHYMLRLTTMPENAQTACREGKIKKSVAFLIARLPNADVQSQAATDLARSQKGKLIGERAARHYIENTFGKQRKRRQSRVVKEFGNDFAANWKKHLLDFDAEQFEEFKRIVKGRVEIGVWSEAVDCVLREAV